MTNFQIPKTLKKRLFSTEEQLANELIAKLDDFADLLTGDKLEFFIEYTDHSIDHINKVLRNIEDLMTIKTLGKLNTQDVSIIIIAVVLHDIGMKATIELFQNMLKGSYDYGQSEMPNNKNLYDDKPWKEVWNDYLKESQFWNAEKKLNVTGNPNYHIVQESNEEQDAYKHSLVYKINHPSELSTSDKRFIGEFIRIHHGRIGYEVAIKGYIGYDGHSISFKDDTLNDDLLQLAGMVARSHSIGLRDNYNYLIKLTDLSNFKSPSDIDIVLHMVLIRLSDYLHIDKKRTNETILYLRKTYSPYSLNEHKKHLAISNIKFKEKEENISVTVTAPVESAELFVNIERLIHDIQSEFDVCWAVLGELYSDAYKLRYRRIISNLSQDGVRKKQSFVPRKFGFKFNSELTKLLIAPLYGDNPSYGVRELVQNAVDACRERMAIDKEYYQLTNLSHVTVSIDTNAKLFTIADTGIGMTIEEIENYFLTIGSSFNNSDDWQRMRGEKNDAKGLDNIYRTGRFGIGILAAFLLGREVRVKTKSIKDGPQGYQFTLSLDKSFIQIDKNPDLEAGTTIEIACDERVLSMLDAFSPKWYNWYIDSCPSVEYYKDNIKRYTKLIDINNGFKKLSHSFSDFGDIYWKIEPRINTAYGQENDSELYINGFLITKSSNKNSFNLKGLEAYNKFRIPPLYVTDLSHAIPINLQRNDLESGTTYPFEKDLAIAVYKDFLCQLVAVDVSELYFGRVNPAFLFFNAKGFTYNRYPALPFLNLYGYSTEPYTASCLSGKHLAHISVDHFEYNEFQPLIINNPDIFFSFQYGNLIDLSIDPLLLQVNGLPEGGTFCVHKDAMNYINTNSISRADRYRFIRQVSDYIVFSDLSPDYVCYIYSLIESINTYVNRINTTPTIFFIHKAGTLNKKKSELNDFFEEYAGGDLIVPYDEDERRKKFAKLYEECSEDIEKYRELY